jgi:hypothetical protein
MKKKDRIAIAVSVIYFIFTFTFCAATIIAPWGIFEGLFFGLVPLSLYWGYRFIKDDISFIQHENNSK